MSMDPFEPLPIRRVDTLRQQAYQVQMGKVTTPHGDSKIKGTSKFENEHAQHRAHWHQEIDRISAYPQFPGLQHYLTVLSVSIVTDFVSTAENAVLCCSGAQNPQKMKLEIGLHLSDPEVIESVAFDIWKINRRSLAKTLRLDDLSLPPSWVQSIPCTPDRQTQGNARFVIPDDDLLNPNIIWISPARLIGTDICGREFSYNFVQKLAAQARQHILEIPANRLFTPRPVAPL